jgi:hypothetical protein
MAITYEPIATSTLASAAASITFSSIAASWTDLRLVIVAVSDATGAGSGLRIQYNNDTGANYTFVNLYATGAAAATANSGGANDYPGLTNASSLSTTVPLFAIADIFSYTGSTFKTNLSTVSSDTNSTGGKHEHMAGLWRSTAAITSVKIYLPNPNLGIGTTATLYGIKAA